MLKNKMIVSHRVTTIFLLGIFISSVIVSPFILDFTLLPRFIFLAGLFIVLGVVLIRSNFKVTIKWDAILASYLAYIVFACSSVFWALNKADALFEAEKLTLGLAVFLFTIYLLKKDHDYFMQGLLKGSVLIFFIVLLLFFYQFIKLQNFNKESLYDLTGMNGHKNLFSSFLFLNLFFLIMASFRLENNWRKIAVIFIISSLILIVFLQTKAVWTGVAVVVFSTSLLYFYQLKIKKKLKGFIIFLIVFIIATNLFFLKILPSVIDTSLSSNDKIITSTGFKLPKMLFDQERLTIWQKTFVICKKHPVAGVGLGNWQIYYPDATLTGLYRCEDLNFTFQRPHNDFLWVLSELGIVGFNLFLVFILLMLFYLIKSIHFGSDYFKTNNSIVLCFSFILGYFTISFFDFPKERIEHLIWINVILALAYSLIKQFSIIKSYSKVVLNFNKITTSIFAFLMLFVLYCGILRYKGEYFTLKLYASKAEKLNHVTLKTCNSIVSFAYSLDPTSLPIYWYRGNAKVELGNYTDALEDFKRAYHLNPYNRNVINDLASSYVFAGDIESAKTYYDEVVRISPRFDEPKLNLTALYIKEENYVKAQEILNSIFHDSERRSSYQKIVDINLGK